MNSMAEVSLALLMPQGTLRNTIEAELSEHYQIQSYNTIEDYLDSNKQESLDLLLCDQLLLEDLQAVLLAALKTASPNSQILVIGPSRPIAVQIAALRHGARGYFDNSLSTDTLQMALSNIQHGEVWVERHVISGLIDELTHVPEISKQQREAVESLSPKELEVAKLVSHGATNKMIANKMAITERTVKAHLTTIFHKMNLPDRLSLAIFFRDLR